MKAVINPPECITEDCDDTIFCRYTADGRISIIYTLLRITQEQHHNETQCPYQWIPTGV